MHIDTAVLPVKRARKADYIELAALMAAKFRAAGALSVKEYWADDLPAGEVTSFPRAVQAAEDEAVVLAVNVWPDEATRDAAMGAVMADPALGPKFADPPMDMRRMFFGAFESSV
ncbi:MAG: DUF1428 domain-containing protein, partial [Pseudomonadota bacterium]